MAYRFTDTNKWGDSWFSNLTTIQKLLFMYFCDNCDVAGFIELIPKKISMDLSCKENDILGAYKGLARGLIFSDNNDVVLVKNFIKHQKNLPINESNNAHKGIIARYENYKHKFDGLNLTINGFEYLGANEGLTSPTGKGNDKGNDNDIGNSFVPNFENLPIWMIEPLKKWLKHKSEKRQNYKPTGFHDLTKSIMKKYPNGLNFAESVDHSISNNYDGLFPCKQNKQAPVQTEPTTIGGGRRNLTNFTIND